MVLQTSMKLSKKSKKEWGEHKNHPKESMEALINRTFKLAYGNEEPLDARDISDIEKSLVDFKNGNFKTNAQLLKELEA